jgi:peptidoglycan/xylan/chitin deacetylase (PgdA/CDA1 family)
MNREEILNLSNWGHEIGSHTFTHAKLCNLSKEQKLDEIKNSKNYLENLLGKEINHFAYTFGTERDFDQECMKISMQSYRYIYTGIRGNNSYNLNKNVIKRDAISCDEWGGSVLIYLNGFFDFRYKKGIKKFMTWVEENK